MESFIQDHTDFGTLIPPRFPPWTLSTRKVAPAHSSFNLSDTIFPHRDYANRPATYE